jgi:hypothetical protein
MITEDEDADHDLRNTSMSEQAQDGRIVRSWFPMPSLSPMAIRS